MRPLTNDRPKPLVELNSKPLIDHVLDRLKRRGIPRAVVNLHYKADMLRAHLAKRNEPAVTFSDETDCLLDTGGGVKRALPLLGDDAFFIYNSDAYWTSGPTANLDRMIEMWDPERMDSLLLLAAVATSVGYSGLGDFTMDQTGRVRRRREKEIAPFVFAGVSIAHPRLFDDTPEGPFSLNMVWSRAIEAERLFGIRHDGIWMHIGTPEALADAEQTLRDRELG